MHWDDAAGTLTLGAREGSFPGMLAERTFRLVVVGKGHGVGVGIGESDGGEGTVSYKGEKVSAKQ